MARLRITGPATVVLPEPRCYQAKAFVLLLAGSFDVA
jgi:hypothetical protein